MKWWQLSIILCCFGFFKEFRPSEPYITPYLTEFKNFTTKQVNQEIYPLGTYFYLFLLIAVFLLTDYLRYKPVMLTGGISGITTWCLLIFGKSLLEMQIVEFFYGVFMASEVAYYCYIYSKVNKIFYQKVTSHTRAAILLGKACAGGTSQLTVSYKLLNYLELNYLSVGGVGIATIFALFLPPVQQSIYFNTKKLIDKGLNKFENQEKNTKEKFEANLKCSFKFCQTGFSILLADIRETATNSYVVHWTIWWALATCGYLQVTSYCQILWQEIVKETRDTLYHGLVELASSLLVSLKMIFGAYPPHQLESLAPNFFSAVGIISAAVAFIVGYIKVPWNLWGEISLGILTITQGSLLFYCSYASDIYTAYILHLSYQMFYHAAITVATYEIAKYVSERSYALVFGICTFLALVVQTVLTVVVIDTIDTDIRNQFKIYGGYHLFIGIAFFIAGILTMICFKRKTITIHF